MKKRMGRPKIGTANAKGVLVAARFTPGEARKINQAVSASGLSKSDWIRKHLLSTVESG